MSKMGIGLVVLVGLVVLSGAASATVWKSSYTSGSKTWYYYGGGRIFWDAPWWLDPGSEMRLEAMTFSSNNGNLQLEAPSPDYVAYAILFTGIESQQLYAGLTYYINNVWQGSLGRFSSNNWRACSVRGDGTYIDGSYFFGGTPCIVSSSPALYYSPSKVYSINTYHTATNNGVTKSGQTSKTCSSQSSNDCNGWA